MKKNGKWNDDCTLEMKNGEHPSGRRIEEQGKVLVFVAQV